VATYISSSSNYVISQIETTMACRRVTLDVVNTRFMPG
jgi:hypothetical protein